MPLPTMNDRQYLEKQYKDSSNLDARINLHQRFSVNPYGWHRWVFDHFDLPSHCRILELGCGPGHLWMDNLGRIPNGWEIVLSDIYAGMLAGARRNLEKQRPFEFKVVDAQSIPCEDKSFDAVIANHMLYHVPDRSGALAEIRRVLKPAGQLYAATNGEQHMSEMAALLTKFDVELSSWRSDLADLFTLENGLAQLSRWFADVKLYRYEDALEVTEVAPLVDYILSGRVGQVLVGRQPDFREFVAREMESHGGVFHITEDGGLFVSVPKGD
jgi:ubiquinone/menaquinone biosynthesis C-methylase UbiE